MMQMDWAQLTPAAEDGALCDILVFDATVADWQSVIDALRTWATPPVYQRDQRPLPLPQRIEPLLADPESGHLLSVTMNGVRFNCHFFDRDEIEFDIDPREVVDAGKMAVVGRFMALLGSVTGKAVVLVEEGGRSDALRGRGIISQWLPDADAIPGPSLF